MAKTARITTHFPALTEPFTAERLTALAQHSGVLLSAENINAAVTQVMDEIGLELTREYPKPLTDDVVQASDVVITMGCGDACPVYPGKRYVDWEQPALCWTADIASAGAPSATARFHVEDTANDDRTCPRQFRCQHRARSVADPRRCGIGTASFLADVGHEIPTALLPSLLTSTLGATAAVLGLIEGISDALAGGALADDPTRRRAMSSSAMPWRTAPGSAPTLPGGSEAPPTCSFAPFGREYGAGDGRWMEPSDVPRRSILQLCSSLKWCENPVSDGPIVALQMLTSA